MQIAVFGATGATGRVFLKSASEHGHRTVAHVRNISRLGDTEADRVVVGEVFEKSALEDTLSGVDAALITFGLKGNRTTPLYSQGTETIISTMRRLNVPRLVIVSEAAYDMHVQGGFNRAVTSLYGITQRPIIRERRAQDLLVESSGLDWTVMRPTILTDDPETARPDIFYKPRNAWLPRTGRLELCTLILESLNDPAMYGRNVYL